MSQALEIQIETAWRELTCMRKGRRRTLYLSPRRLILWEGRGTVTGRCTEIGTYTGDVTLGNLREDVFWTHAQREAALGAPHG